MSQEQVTFLETCLTAVLSVFTFSFPLLTPTLQHFLFIEEHHLTLDNKSATYFSNPNIRYNLRIVKQHLLSQNIVVSQYYNLLNQNINKHQGKVIYIRKHINKIRESLVMHEFHILCINVLDICDCYYEGLECCTSCFMSC